MLVQKRLDADQDGRAGRIAARGATHVAALRRRGPAKKRRNAQEREHFDESAGVALHSSFGAIGALKIMSERPAGGQLLKAALPVA